MCRSIVACAENCDTCASNEDGELMKMAIPDFNVSYSYGVHNVYYLVVHTTNVVFKIKLKERKYVGL